MVRTHTDVGHLDALGQLGRVDPHDAQGAAVGFCGGELVRGCVWSEGGEGGGCEEGEEEGEGVEGFHGRWIFWLGVSTGRAKGKES